MDEEQAYFFVNAVINAALETKIGVDTLCGFAIHNTAIAVPTEFIDGLHPAKLAYSNIEGDSSRVCFLTPHPEQDDINSIPDHRYYAGILCHEGTHLGQQVDDSFILEKLEDSLETYIHKRFNKELEAVSAEVLDFLQRSNAGTLGNYNGDAKKIADAIHSRDTNPYDTIRVNKSIISNIYRETDAWKRQLAFHTNYYHYAKEHPLTKRGFQDVNRHEFFVLNFPQVQNALANVSLSRE
jgi:hypothetical protein